jgi:arginyl-tRNA synthetase
MPAMSDPRSILGPAFARAIEAAYGSSFAGTDPMLRRSDRADYQANVALGLKKRVGAAPRDIAGAIVAKLELGDVCAAVEIAGPGYINLTLAPAFLARELAAVARDPRLGVEASAAPETVVVDYSAPNVAKEMHVGHIRSTIIGDALCRVLEALGHRVVRQNHLGDWGTPFGMLIEHVIDLGGAEKVAETSVGDLDALYKQARAKFDQDPAFAERARRRVVLLQGGDAETLALWKVLVDQSRRYFAAAYARLGVTLTDADVAGESMYNSMLDGIVRELEEQGLARESEGAMCTFPPGFTGKEGEPLPLILRKQDGGYGYATTDLAAIRYRTQKLEARRVLYVVGSPQSQHLAMVFATAKAAGWLAPPARAEHVAFGSVLGTDKKMFKTRAGDTVKLVSLIDEAERRAEVVVTEKNAERDEGDRLDAAAMPGIARAIGVGSIKYADLSSDRIKDYVFDWDRMLATVGNTAPYLQYAHARVRSIFRKSGGEAAPGEVPFELADPTEKALALELLGFGEVVNEVSGSLHPHVLCTYLFGVASTFSTFYQQCPVLKADNEALRRSRLALCDLTARVLARGLELLGIEAPDRM